MRATRLQRLVLYCGWSMGLLLLPCAQSQTFRVLHTFQGSPDGATPNAGVIRDANGNLYGTTYVGGTSGGGTVFKLSPTGQETILYAFCPENGCADGAAPWAGVTRDANDNFYGVTLAGGSKNDGVLFEVDSSGQETVLHSFTADPDGSAPFATPILDSQGNIYGTTMRGGTYRGGTVYEFAADGTETILYSFRQFYKDYFPMTGVLLDRDGNLYGTTAGGDGAVFRLTKSGRLTELYKFTGFPDGNAPSGALTADSAGNLYGTTARGGAHFVDGGTLFRISKSSKETILYSFCAQTNCTDGAGPTGGVIRDSLGNFYGVTESGGAYNQGTVFKVSKTGQETVLYSFTGGADGGGPTGGLTRDDHGDLYGTTYNGGFYECDAGQQGGCGVVFELTP